MIRPDSSAVSMRPQLEIVRFTFVPACSMIGRSAIARWTRFSTFLFLSAVLSPAASHTLLMHSLRNSTQIQSYETDVAGLIEQCNMQDHVVSVHWPSSLLKFVTISLGKYSLHHTHKASLKMWQLRNSVAETLLFCWLTCFPFIISQCCQWTVNMWYNWKRSGRKQPCPNWDTIWQLPREAMENHENRHIWFLWEPSMESSHMLRTSVTDPPCNVMQSEVRQEQEQCY
jgi:hypothetical protein